LSFCGGTRDVEGEKEGERKREKCQKLWFLLIFSWSKYKLLGKKPKTKWTTRAWLGEVGKGWGGGGVKLEGGVFERSREGQWSLNGQGELWRSFWWLQRAFNDSKELLVTSKSFPCPWRALQNLFFSIISLMTLQSLQKALQ
jgi:hypothetical protein